MDLAVYDCCDGRTITSRVSFIFRNIDYLDSSLLCVKGKSLAPLFGYSICWIWCTLEYDYPNPTHL